jgi:putative peptidoglycan lipid II flippase
VASVGRTAPWQILSRAGTALLPILLATWYGRSEATDLYNLMAALFVLAGSLVFGCFQDSALVPIVVDVERREPELLPRLAGALFTYTLLIAGAVAALIGAGAWLRFHARASAAVAPLVSVMALGFSLQLPFLALRTLAASLLQARFRFLPDVVASGVNVAVTVAVAAGAHRFGLGVVPFAIAGGELAALIVLVAALHRSGLSVRPTWARPAPLARFVRLVSAEIGGAAVVRVNPIVDQAVAAGLGVIGGGTMLRLSGDLAGFPASLAGSAFLSVLLSHLAAAAVEGRKDQIRRTVAGSALVVAGTMALAAAALFVLRVPLVHLVYGRGAMDAAGLARIAHILGYHLLGLPPFGALLVLARAHVSLGNSRMLVGAGLLSATSNLALNLILAPLLGLEGIALSTSIASLLVAGLFWQRLQIRLRAPLPALARLRA